MAARSAAPGGQPVTRIGLSVRASGNQGKPFVDTMHLYATGGW